MLEKPCVRSRGHIFSQIIMKLDQHVFYDKVRICSLMKSRTSLKMGDVGSITRLLGQMWEKPCVCSRGHILSPIIMKLDQHVFHDEFLNKFKMGHVGSKTWSPGQILEKPCVHSRGHIFSLIIMKLAQNNFLDGISYNFENKTNCQVKT